MRHLPLLLLGSGCWLSPGEIDDKVRLVEVGGGELDSADTGITEKTTCFIKSIEPAYGTNAGGTELAIAVDLSGTDPIVRIGQKEAEFDRVEDGIVYVYSPSTKRDGATPVTVETSSESCVLEEGFRLFEDGQGLAGAYGVFEWHDFQGWYWADGDSFGSAEFSFIKPIEVSYADIWGESLDECVSNFVPSIAPSLSKYQPEGPAQLNGPGSTLAFAWDVKRSQYEGNLTEGDFEGSASYSLQPISFPGSDWPVVEIPGFIDTPAPINITMPVVDDTFMNYLFDDSLVLKWGGALNGDYVIARVWRIVNNSTAEEVRCLLTDDGSYTIDSTVWSGWSFQNQYLAIELGRVRESRAILPYDLSQSSVVGIHWTHGAVWTL